MDRVALRSAFSTVIKHCNVIAAESKERKQKPVRPVRLPWGVHVTLFELYWVLSWVCRSAGVQECRSRRPTSRTIVGPFYNGRILGMTTRAGCTCPRKKCSCRSRLSWEDYHFGPCRVLDYLLLVQVTPVLVVTTHTGHVCTVKDCGTRKMHMSRLFN